jgi:hypothetical protein
MRLIDCFVHWDALEARVPLGQWREPTSGECADCKCEYVQLQLAEAMSDDGTVGPERRKAIKPCSHREKYQVDDGVVFKKALSYTNSDPHAIVALKADIERQLARLPRLPRQLFWLMYQQGGDKSLSMQDACKVLRIRSLRDAGACHDLWLRRMERALVDWFPAAKRDYERTLVSA